MKHVPQFDFPPALPRGDRAGDGFTGNGALLENTPVSGPPSKSAPSKSAEYSPALFDFPGGQLRQGTVCEGASPDAGPSEGSGYGPGALSAVRVACRPQTVKIPAALLTPHHKAGTAGPQTNPPQGGGQLLSLAAIPGPHGSSLEVPMSVIWEVNVSLMRHPESEFIRVLHGSTVRKYDTEEAAQAAYVDAIKQLGGKQ